MSDPPRLRERRLAFGSVAAQYDRARPSYPAEVFDTLIEHADLRPGERVLEVGAGTGKATRLLLDRGLHVIAVEPDPAMADLLARNCRGRELEVVQGDFEGYKPHERVRLIVSAQAWHWVDHATGFARAHEVLAPEGVLAAIWTVPDWQTTLLRDALRAAYAAHAPELEPEFPMHPGSGPVGFEPGWREGIDSVAGFGDACSIIHRWRADYTAEQYCQLIATHQDHILLEASRREALLEAIAAAIDRDGGRVELVYATFLGMARSE